MAVRIKFDGAHNPIQPSIVLATRRGRKIGKLPALNVKFKDSMNNGYDMSFTVNQPDCPNIWDKIQDFKLIWVREWNLWFEIEVDIQDTGSMSKNITAVALGKAELSQIKLYNKEINTEEDISREGYEPTVFYNPENPDASLLHRILDKAPHYSIGHVDTSLNNIQRTFSFNDRTIYDSFQDVATEIECLIRVDCVTGENGKILRQVNAYDLKSVCLECGSRGDFIDVCDHCGSHDISNGYGKDTSIYISTENLADNIKYSTDNGSVKNCFRLEAGDDLMTAAVVSCNPNGSGYIWHISDSMKEDMSEELVSKLANYDNLYAYYRNEHHVSIPTDIMNRYNSLIDKYSVFSQDYKKIGENIVGYPALMQSYFDTIDFEMYLSNGLMPAPKMIDTTAQKQIENISTALLYGVSVKNLSSCSAATAESAVLGIAKAATDNRYEIRVSDSIYSNNTWSGIVQVTNASNEEDTAVSTRLSCVVNDDYAGYVKQKILKMFNKSTDDATGIDQMFKLSEDAFRDEMHKYCLSRLQAFHDICQSCLDILIEHGIADKSKWSGLNDDLYESIYVPYFNKLRFIEEEIRVREDEIAVVSGKYDINGNLITHGLKSFIQDERDTIQKNLNFDEFLGEECLTELSAYRREDTYKNANYISDGLSNSELFQYAQRFIEVARSEILKSSTLQHKISAKLKNILAMKEFEIIVEYFEIGNWIRVKTDGKLNKLRLIEYEISFDDFDNIDVDFSDVVSAGGVMSDIESIIDQASSMASSYETVARQAKQGKKSNAQLTDWVERGLDLTKMRIIDSADNQNISWDSHGILCKEYLPIMGVYDDKQLKIINRGLYLTDDGWETSKAGIGDFTYWNPKTGKMEESYGVIADVIVGNIILSEEVGIYNQNNSITMDKNGLTITSISGEDESPIVFNVRKKIIDEDGNEGYLDELYLDADGNLVINGSVKIFSKQTSSASGTLDDLDQKVSDVKDDLKGVQDRIDGFNGLHFYIRYSESADGSNMTISPDENTVYMGTCNTDEKVAPIDPGRYTWVKIKGERGIQGINGIDGKTYHLHIKYSDDGETFTGNDGYNLGDWIGTCVSESEKAPSDFNAYTWSKFNGANGINTAYVMLYKRYEIKPDRPSTSTVYSFETGMLTGTLEGWSQTMPPSNGCPCYMIQAIAASQEMTDTIEAREWSEPVKIVEDGVPGANGYNTATVYLYKRSDTRVSSIDWTDTLTYSFSLASLTSVPNGWSSDIPDGDLPLYVTAATVASTTPTDTIEAEEWSMPVLLSKSGTDGINGLNSATIFLYQRSNTIPEKPTDDMEYTFASGVLTNAGNWKPAVPEGNSPCYVIHATAVSRDSTDIISSTEWSDPTILAQNGNDGLNGHNTAVVYLYKRSSSAAVVDWSEKLTYSFSTKSLVSVPVGWSQTIPSGTNPIYVTMAGAYSDTDSDDISVNEWCTPVVLAQNGSNGQTYYTWIKYADTPTSGMSDDPTDKTYIGIAYNKTSKTESSDYNDYSWSLIKGANGIDGIDGKTYYTWIRYAEDDIGTNMSADPSGKDYIGVAYNKLSSEASDIATDYTWSLFKGADGIDGKDGANGISSYFYVRYSEREDGSNMTATPTDTTVYIGVCSTTSPTAPTDVSSYKWSKFRGNDGIPGAAGADGRTQYLHIKYSDDGETFTGNNGEDLGNYIGTLVDFNQEDSTVFSDYKWKQFSGDLSVDLAEIQQKIDESADSIRGEIEQRENGIRSEIEGLSDDIRGSITSQVNAVRDTIQKNYEDVMGQATALINSHTAELGQYMEFGNSGLILGASSSSFKTVIDNSGMYFKEGDAIVSYVMNNQLHIPNAVIESTMALGNFFFSPRSDGGVSLVWKEKEA